MPTTAANATPKMPGAASRASLNAGGATSMMYDIQGRVITPGKQNRLKAASSMIFMEQCKDGRFRPTTQEH
jgi:hypothetical protein